MKASKEVILRIKITEGGENEIQMKGYEYELKSAVTVLLKHLAESTMQSFQELIGEIAAAYEVANLDSGGEDIEMKIRQMINELEQEIKEGPVH